MSSIWFKHCPSGCPFGDWKQKISTKCIPKVKSVYDNSKNFIQDKNILSNCLTQGIKINCFILNYHWLKICATNHKAKKYGRHLIDKRCVDQMKNDDWPKDFLPKIECFVWINRNIWSLFSKFHRHVDKKSIFIFWSIVKLHFRLTKKIFNLQLTKSIIFWYNLSNFPWFITISNLAFLLISVF